MPSNYALSAAALEQIINNEFSASEGVVATHDKPHEALGYNGPVVGIFPNFDQPNSRTTVAEEAYVEVRYYDQWDKQIDPAQAVDPRIITEKAFRLKRAIKSANVHLGGNMWFFNVERTEYPDDPTGNKTRFHMLIRAWGNNPALAETSA